MRWVDSIILALADGTLADRARLRSGGIRVQKGRRRKTHVVALAKGATMRGRLDTQSDERSLNLDAVRASLEEAAAVLAEMTEVDASNRRARVSETAK